MAIAFIIGSVLGGIIAAMLVYAYMKGKYDKAVTESYTKGYAAGSETEKRAIFDYIELLNRDANTNIYNDELSKGSEN